MPKLWSETVEIHRREVRDAILDATAALVAEYGLQSVTMSQIAETTGISRATLYKYFPSVEAILFAWHERQVSNHLHQLASIRDQEGDAGERLEAVLAAFASICFQHHGTEIAVIGHQGAHIARAQQQLSRFVEGLLSEVAQSGNVRDDIPLDELASYCLHALTAASELDSHDAVRRLVIVTLAGLRRPT
jgi:AcrR family transcriptional regulator